MVVYHEKLTSVCFFLILNQFLNCHVLYYSWHKLFPRLKQSLNFSVEIHSVEFQFGLKERHFILIIQFLFRILIVTCSSQLNLLIIVSFIANTVLTESFYVAFAFCSLEFYFNISIFGYISFWINQFRTCTSDNFWAYLSDIAETVWELSFIT